MAALDLQRHTAALRVLLGMEPQTSDLGPAPGYDGPAIWIGPMPGDHRVNAAGSVLRDAEGMVEPAIAAFVAGIVAAHAPRSASVQIDAADGRARHFALTGLLQDGGILVLARETTAETENVRALKASREMFRDVALSAGGLAFETDEMGLFRWVGPGNALGFAAHEMAGRPAKEFLLPQSPDAFDPFAAREIIDDAPVWAQSLDQGPRALRVSVRPVFDGTGVWRGVRGHARDETNDLRHARRERFVEAAVEALRNAHSPQALLQSLAHSAAEACGARAAWIFNTAPGPDCVVSNASAPCDLVCAIASRAMSEGVQYPALFSAGDWTGLSIALRSNAETQGALLVAQPASGGEVTRDAQEMLRLIAPMASVAVAQARMMVKAMGHSPRDALTGLLNPAAWRDGLTARLASGAQGLVLVVECDRFKAFGDGLGRAASDELLIEIAAGLRAVAAPGGLCARLDDACFAMWFEGATEASVNRLAGDIAHAFRVASRRMSLALAATPLTGVALTGPAATAEGLMQTALQALAASKRTGRARGAPPPCSKT